jgi:hypothetical protein
MEKVYILLLLLCFINCLNAQEVTQSKKSSAITLQDTGFVIRYSQFQDLLYAKNHLSLRIGTFLSKGYHVSISSYSPYHIENPIALGMVGAMDYTINLDAEWGIRVGLTFGAFPQPIKFRIPSDGSTPDGYFTHHVLEFTPHIAIPCELIYRRPINRHWTASARAGITLRKVIGADISYGYFSGNGINEIEVFQWENTFDESAWPVIPSLAVGVSLLTRWQDMISLHAIAHISSRGLYDEIGIYQGSEVTFFPNDPEKIQKGKYVNKGSYIGLELSYTLTQARSMLKKAGLKR